MKGEKCIDTKSPRGCEGRKDINQIEPLTSVWSGCSKKHTDDEAEIS